VLCGEGIAKRPDRRTSFDGQWRCRKTSPIAIPPRSQSGSLWIRTRLCPNPNRCTRFTRPAIVLSTGRVSPGRRKGSDRRVRAWCRRITRSCPFGEHSTPKDSVGSPHFSRKGTSFPEEHRPCLQRVLQKQSLWECLTGFRE